jgi:RHS repeat-associated protein
MTMSETSGVSEQVLSLPKGGGAVQGLGTTFETDLNTGTGSYDVPLELPAGPNGMRPHVSIRYHSAAGNGPFGVGWALGLMSITRQIDGRIPDYGPDDNVFALTGAEELVEVAPGRYRPRVDTMHYRILRQPPHSPDGWEITDTRGTVYDLGRTAQARVETVEGGLTKTAAWLLERMTDTNGNRAQFVYALDGLYPYLQRVEWGTYSLRFTYEARADRLSSGRYGLLQRIDRRCSRIELHVTNIAPTLARSWALEYMQAPGAALSLLNRIVMTGHAADGGGLSAPPITLGYTEAQPRGLTRFDGVVPGAVPGDLGGGRLELLDWDGDGLPDVLELRGGRARVWPNRGRCRWGAPQTLSEVPTPVHLAEPGVAFADMDGNGTADLVLLDRPLAGYYPLRPGGGFDRPVHWRQAPSTRLAGGEGRLLDLNGDGIIDLLVTGEDYFTLYLRAATDGWQPRPRTIPRGAVPPVSFRDPHVHIADMNGDGLQDLVRVDGGGVTYWPYLGNGRWADAVEMSNAPALPRRYDPRRLFVSDVDGDGCADLVYVDYDRVTVWLNQGGSRVGGPQEHRFTPPARTSQVRLADMTGSGTAGVLWASIGLGGRAAGQFYLDLNGGSKPYLLNRIDNGVGLETRIEYRPSTEYAVDAEDAGSPWRTFHPFPVQCVARVELHDRATGQVGVTRHTYFDARYDGEARAFLGFGRVDVENVGDVSVPTSLVRNFYHLGLDPNDLGRWLSGDERLRFGALRRRLLRTEAYGLDGSAAQARPYTVTRHEYAARVEPALGGESVLVPYETRTLQEHWERGAAPFSVREIMYSEPDAYGNIPRQRMVVTRAGVAAPDQDVTTEVTFAQNVAAHVVSLPARITQKDAAGALLSATVTHYDGPPHVGLPEGQATAGNVTRVDKLAVPDDLAARVYGAAQPDWAALSYHRRAGEGGWWVTQNSYERQDVAAGLALITRGPRGLEARLDYDPTRQYPVRLTDASGCVYQAAPDLRAFQIGATTDPNNQVVTDRFDALGRVVAVVKPGDSDALPTSRHVYQTGALPVSVTTTLRAASGGPATLDQVQYVNGRGQPLQQIVPGEGDAGRRFIARVTREYGTRGHVSAVYTPYYVDDTAYAPPGAGRLKTVLRYDATGRLLQQVRVDGGVVTQVYGPGRLEVAEATGAADPAPRRVVQNVDGLDRVVSTERTLNGRVVRATFEYDGLNRLVRTVTPDGGEVRLTFDLLGRLLVDEGPDTGRTVNVIDAAGNQVRRTTAGGRTVVNSLDALDRIVDVREQGSATPEAVYTYLNPGGPNPPDGPRNRVGRLWKVQDRLGTLTSAYDPLGRVVQTVRTVEALGNHALVTDVAYDALGRQAQVTLPAPTPGAPRRVVEYRYNARGLPVSSPGYVPSAEYDVEGRLTKLVYQNGVENRTEFHPLTGRPSRLRVLGAGGAVLRDQTFTFDPHGNLSAIASPLPVEAGQFHYDDFDRLTEATYGSGEHFAYQYSDGGNITHIDGLGNLSYGAAPGRCAVTKAGAGDYTYDVDGRLKTAPYGALQFNAFDNLVHVDLTGGGAVDYVYDFNGLLAIRRVAGGPVTIFADAHVEYHNGQPLVWVAFNRRRILALSGGNSAYPHDDLLGMATLFTDAAGQVARRLAFGPYGTIRFDSAAAGAEPGPRFGGQFLDDRTGLICMGRRFYDPRLGRFLTADVLAVGAFHLDGWNRYAYAHNNPLRYTDPTGLFSWADFFAIVAVVVVVAALIVASVVTLGVADVVIAGVSISVSGLYATAAVGVAGGAILGGMAAAKAGGDVWKGVLLGGFLGGVSAVLGGALSSWALSYPLFGSAFLAKIAAGAIAGAVMGAGSGVAIGYAGGQGDSQSIWKHFLAGAFSGALSGAVMGFVVAGLNSTSVLKIGTLDKFDPAKAAAGDALDKVNYLDNAGSVGQDLTHTAVTGDWAAYTEFVNAGTGSQEWTWGNIFFNNGAVLNIPIGWVPTAALHYGGIVGMIQLSIGLDKFAGLAYDTQIIFLFNAFPFVGIALGFAFGEGGYGKDYKDNAGWYDDFKGALHKNFSMEGN